MFKAWPSHSGDTLHRPGAELDPQLQAPLQTQSVGLPLPSHLAGGLGLRQPPPSARCGVTGGKGPSKARQERKARPRGDQTALRSQPGPSPASAPLLGKKRTKLKLAVIEQLSGNQIIPRTEKPINKGARKTNSTAGAARKCLANTNRAARMLEAVWGERALAAASEHGGGPQSEDALPWGTPESEEETQPSPRELSGSLRRRGLCPGGKGFRFTEPLLYVRPCAKCFHVTLIPEKLLFVT